MRFFRPLRNRLVAGFLTLLTTTVQAGEPLTNAHFGGRPASKLIDERLQNPGQVLLAQFPTPLPLVQPPLPPGDTAATPAPSPTPSNVPSFSSPSLFGGFAGGGATQRRYTSRLANAPDMFGDFFGTGSSGIRNIQTVQQSFFGVAQHFDDPAVNRLRGQYIEINAVPGSSGTDPGLSVLTTAQINALLFADFGATFALQEDPESTAFLNQNASAFVNGASAAVFVSASSVAVDPITLMQQLPFTPFRLIGDFDITETYDFLIVVDVPTPGAGGGVVGRQKIAENASPLPRDRVFWNYSNFNNVGLALGGVNVQRMTPGFEKTFFNESMSIEARFPFATTLDSDIALDGFTNSTKVEPGNVVFTVKSLLHSTDDFVLAGGLMCALPTADDINFSLAGADLVRIENEAVHLLPFVGGLYAADDRFFAHGFVQFDFDTNGNPVLINVNGNGLEFAGTANDTTFLFVDVGLGYWIFRDHSRGRIVQGLAPTVELHYNRALQDTEVISAGNTIVGNFAENIELLNAVVGVTAELGNDATLGAAFVTPIGGGADQQFDGELRLTFNWFFGDRQHP